MRGLTNSDVNFLSPYSGEFIHHTHFSTILGVVALQRDYSVTLSRGPLSSEKHKKCFININSSFDYSITILYGHKEHCVPKNKMTIRNKSVNYFILPFISAKPALILCSEFKNIYEFCTIRINLSEFF